MRPSASHSHSAEKQYAPTLSSLIDFLLGCGNIFFHNGSHSTILLAHDPAKPARIFGDDRQHGKRAGILLLGFDKLLENFATQ